MPWFIIILALQKCEVLRVMGLQEIEIQEVCNDISMPDQTLEYTSWQNMLDVIYMYVSSSMQQLSCILTGCIF